MADLAAWCQVSASKPGTVRDMHVSHFRLNGPSSVTIARNERPDYRRYNIRTHTVRLRLNIRFQTLKFRGGTVWWLSGSCSNADIFDSSSPHLPGGRSALRYMIRLTEYVRSVYIPFFNGNS